MPDPSQHASFYNDAGDRYAEREYYAPPAKKEPKMPTKTEPVARVAAPLAFWWFLAVSSLSDGWQANIGPFQTREDCEQARTLYAMKFFGWISAECLSKPVVLVPTGEAS